MRRATRLRPLLGALALCLGCAVGPEPPPPGLAPTVDPTAFPIEPGVGAAGIRLDMRRAEVLAALGTPDDYVCTDDDPPAEALSYSGIRIQLLDDRVFYLTLDSRFLGRLLESAPLGGHTDVQDVIDRWGIPTGEPSATYLPYSTRGVGCSFDPNTGRLVSVSVFARVQPGGRFAPQPPARYPIALRRPPSLDPHAQPLELGRAAAGVALGAEVREVSRALGSPLEVALHGDGLRYAYPELGLAVDLREGRVQALELSPARWPSLAARLADAPAAAGQRVRYAPGLAADYDAAGRLAALRVVAPDPAGRPLPEPPAPDPAPPARDPAPPARDPAPQPAARALSADGATARVPGAPATARLRRLPEAPAPRTGWRWASAVFELEGAPGHAPTPVELALELDPQALPAGVAPEDVALVLVHAGGVERLRDARYDAEAGVVRCATRRTAALVHARGGATDRSERNARFALAVPLTRQVLLARSEWYEVWAAREHREAIEPDLDALRALLTRVRRAFPTFRDVEPPFVYVHLVDLPPGVAGQASGGNTMELQAAGRWGFATVAHEYFHLLQQSFVIQHLDALGESVTPETVFRGRWLAEATAEFMGRWVLGDSGRAAEPLWPGASQFCYRGLFETDDFDVGVPRQYVAALFFDFLAEHYDAEALIRRCYEVFMSREHVRALDTWSDAYVLRGVLATTKDRRGRTRTLNQVYAEFLLHYNYLKSFEPLRSRVAELDLGPAGTVQVPPDRLQRRQVPSPDGDRQVRVRASGPGYSIVAAYAFSPPAQTGEGDLVLELVADDDERPVDGKLLLVVFPVKGGATGAPILKGPDDPLTLSGWSAHDEALVWLVDASPFGAHAGRLTARFEGPDPRLAQAEVALKVKACTPAGAERGRFQSPTARLELWLEGVDSLGLDPRASDPVRTVGGSPNANSLLLRFDYDGLTGYRLIDDEGLEDLQLPLRRVGAFPATLQVFAPGFDGPVLRHAFEVACVEGKPRGEVPARYAEEDARLAARWRAAAERGSYALWSQWLQTHHRRVQAQRASFGSGWLLRHADELAQEFDRRVAAVGNPFQRGATPPLPGVRLDLELYRARFDVANDWLRQIESWLRSPAHPPERPLEFTRKFIKESAYYQVARVYAEWLLDGDAAEDLLQRYRALRPDYPTPRVFRDFERAIERARAARRVFPPAAFAR